MAESGERDRRMTSILIRAILILLPVIGGYYLITTVQEEKKQPVGNPNPIARKYGTDVLVKVYPDLKPAEIDQLLTESWSRTLAYETFTQFKEHSYTGKYVNIDKAGFRHIKNQAPWPPDPESFNIFVFGGSVTFGYGAQDSQTIPSYLQELLSEKLNYKVSLYNFGRGHYYSRQELLLYENLLLKGVVPDMALFIDGSNDFYYSNNKALFSNKFESLVTRILAPEARTEDDRNTEIYEVVDRYMATRKMIEAISSIYGVKTVFAWHPTPLYKYDMTYHLFAKESYKDHSWAGPAYKYMAAFVKDHPPGRNFIWCADIQENLKEPLYVDRFHFTSKLASLVASCIGNQMLRRRLIRPEM